MILDELDSGVGARLGRAMGKMLCKMTSSAGPSANASQILCVSHLPQVRHSLFNDSVVLGPTPQSLLQEHELS